MGVLDAPALSLGLAVTKFPPSTWILPILGQSNAVGAALDRDTNIDTTDPRVLQYARSGASSGQIIASSEPLKNPAGNTDFSFAIPLAKLMLAKLPVGSTIVLVPCGWSGTTIMPGSAGSGYETNCWRTTFTPPSGGKNLTLDSVAAINDAITKSGGGKLLGFFYLQGESDGAIGTAKATYQTELDLIIDYFRTNVTGAANAPFVLGGMVPQGVLDVPGRIPINEVHIDTPRRKPLTAFAPGVLNASRIYPPGTTDTTHYNALGQRTLGRRMAEAFERARANIIGTVPGVPRNVKIALDGIAWTPPEGRVTGYALGLSVNGVPATATTIAAAYPMSLAATDMVTASIAATSEAGAGDAAYAERVRVYTAPSDPLANAGIVFDRALSLQRRVVVAYTGPLGTVRRSSDNTTLDFNSISEAAAFCGSGDGFLVKWFDQSGNSRNMQQLTDAKQPKVITAGASIPLGTSVGAMFDGVDDYVLGNAGMYAAGSATVAMVLRRIGSASVGPGGEFSSTSGNPIYELSYASGATIDLYIRDNAATEIKNGSTGGSPSPLQLSGTAAGQFVITDTGSAVKRRFMKVSQTDIAYTRSGTVGLNQTSLGARVRDTASGFFSGVIGEVLQVYSALPDDKRVLVENSQVSAFGVVV